MRSLGLILVVLMIAPAGLAANGVVEINQACAESANGCFSGDASGFPVTIDGSAGKSYRLTGDLVVSNRNATAIQVSTSSVTLDLGGFEIRGTTTCSGTPLTCFPIGTGDGVSGSGQALIHVKNGSVVGMGDHGIIVGDSGIVENVHATQNGFRGILGASSSVLRNNVAALNRTDGIVGTFRPMMVGNTAFDNGSSGLSAGHYATISRNSAYRNGGNGIAGGAGSTIRNNAAYMNGADGIGTFDASLIVGNSVYENGNDGIQGASGVTILDNTAVKNGDTTNPTTDDGIQCLAGCTVRGNTVRDNLGFGINLSTDSAYRENVVTNNTTGAITGAGQTNNLNDNYCAGTGVALASCP